MTPFVFKLRFKILIAHMRMQIREKKLDKQREKNLWRHFSVIPHARCLFDGLHPHCAKPLWLDRTTSGLAVVVAFHLIVEARSRQSFTVSRREENIVRGFLLLRDSVPSLRNKMDREREREGGEGNHSGLVKSLGDTFATTALMLFSF